VAVGGFTASVVIALAAVFFAVSDGHSGGGAKLASTAVALPPVTNAVGIEAAVTYRSVAWGTSVEITMSNVPDGYSCTLSAYDKSGAATVVSSWWAVPGQRSVTVTGATALAAASIDHFKVHVSDQASDITIPMMP